MHLLFPFDGGVEATENSWRTFCPFVHTHVSGVGQDESIDYYVF